MPTKADAQSLQITLCKQQWHEDRWVLNPDLRPQGIDDYIDRVVPLLMFWHKRLTKARSRHGRK